MSIEIIVNVPSDFVVKDEPQTQEEQQLADTMQRLRAIWTGDPQPGTRTYNGRKLIVAKVQASLDELEQAIAAFGYEWQVLGAKDDAMIRKPAADDVMPFMLDKPVTDDSGEVTGYERPTKAALGTYAGSIPWSFQ
ncbi:hypothetical protein [Halofilum ochraceum]|uniref:hypothetical protein n=1 Tax=Halofilum ochraceum TaxID=1611323 RepID=UPI0008DA8BF3|nr:hypothetical protein [Halofilum ochraceum]